MQRCGLKTIKEELELKRLVLGASQITSKPAQPSAAASPQAVVNTGHQKLKSTEMKGLKPEEM